MEKCVAGGGGSAPPPATFRSHKNRKKGSRGIIASLVGARRAHSRRIVLIRGRQDWRDWRAAYGSPDLLDHCRKRRRRRRGVRRADAAGAAGATRRAASARSRAGPVPNRPGRILVPAGARGEDDDV